MRRQGHQPEPPRTAPQEPGPPTRQGAVERGASRWDRLFVVLLLKICGLRFDALDVRQHVPKVLVFSRNERVRVAGFSRLELLDLAHVRVLERKRAVVSRVRT